MITFDDGYDDVYTQAFPALQKHNQIAVFYLSSGLLDKPGYLTRQQVRLMDQAGMVIAVHTVSHADLTMEITKDQEKELRQSKKDLETLVGHPVVHMAYPYGRYNQEIEDLAKALGYQTAVTTKHDLTGEDTNLLQLPRLRIANYTPLDRVLP